MIAARNESRVIAQLIDSIRKQDCPAELIDIFVVADNCTDNTAAIARQAGAVVYERFNDVQRGKSYALDFLINRIFEDHPDDYKGFMVFDADNLLTKSYIQEMNKAVNSGLRIITSYRNSKNFGRNWITSGYALCFLRECRFIHRSRQRLGTSSFVGGTGFYVEADIFRREKGWKYNLLTEDMEFSIAQALKGERVGYAEDAEFYDEQPETFGQSYQQRMRWIRGAYQTFWYYGRRLAGGIFGRHGYAKLDLMLFIIPIPFLFEICLFLNMLLHLGYGTYMLGTDSHVLVATLKSIVWFLANSYLYIGVTFAYIMLLEWRRIKLSPARKILHMFLSPLFVMTYMIIIITAMLYKVSWTPIRRNCTVNISELEGGLEGKPTPAPATAKTETPLQIAQEILSQNLSNAFLGEQHPQKQSPV